jgi:Ni/Co efflux regulator RcnB
MKMNKLVVTLIFGSVLAWSAAPVLSQSNNDSSPKKDLQKAGHATADAAKTAGKDVKKGTEKAYDVSKKDTKKASHATVKGTKKVWDKTRNTTKGAIHGGEEGAKKPDASKN